MYYEFHCQRIFHKPNSLNKAYSVGDSFFLLPAIITTISPMMAMIKKDMRRLNNPATIPMSGGPIKNPRKPMLETAASAIPGETFFERPASLYTSGTTLDTPKPTMKK